MKTKIALLLGMITGLLVLSSGVRFRKDDVGASAAVDYFSRQVNPFVQSAATLLQAVQVIDQDSASVIPARKALLECRLRYKSISFFTSYFFPSETRMYNAAAKYEVEEPELELVEPMGLQQIEALLFEDQVYGHKEDLIDQVEAFNSSVKDLKNLLYQFNASDQQVLESVRIELIRIMTLYISGYDAPLLKSGISEALVSSKSLQAILQPYIEFDGVKSKQLSETLNRSIAYLQLHQEFDAFDRMEYLVSYALPFQEQVGQLIARLNLQLNTSAYLNYKAGHLYSPDFLQAWDSIAPSNRKALAQLGQQLFFEKGFSGNLQVSCASCHRPEHYFSDGKVKSASLVGDTTLRRNTPSLMYAGFQHSQFWDGRSKTMVAQIKDVLFNPLEMGGSKASVDKQISNNPQYREALDRLFPQSKGPDERLDHIALAITAFVSELNPLNSPFDNYIAGNKKAMSNAQIKGFNLFMGKAQCGTCHFAPYFNSLVPPFYDISELEVLGTTKDDAFTKPQYDGDQGRFDLYKIRFYKQAFKTPTVRNTEKTGPYMHNGAFKSLETVIEFYNKGGAAGLGLATPEQTLSSRPLNLSPEESEQIIQFIKSLTDKAYAENIKSSK